MSESFDDYVQEIIDTAPVSELLALMAAREHTAKQVAEDTCATHGEWCCPHCFDLTPLDPNGD